MQEHCHSLPIQVTSGGKLTQLAIGGDDMLGGRDFDHALYELCRSRIDSVYGTGALSDPESKYLLLRECEAMKVALTDSPKVE